MTAQSSVPQSRDPSPWPDEGHNGYVIEVAGTRVIKPREGLVSVSEARARAAYYRNWAQRMRVAHLAAPTRRSGT